MVKYGLPGEIRTLDISHITDKCEMLVYIYVWLFCRPEESMETDEMPDATEFHDVYLTEMDMPDLIFLQRHENYKRWSILNYYTSC